MLLGIDTCGTTGTVALGRLSGAELEIMGQAELPSKTNASDLIPQMRALLEEHHVSLAEIEVLVVVSGPGSFTGVRVGLSTAKGLAEALDKPVIAVSRLAVLAWKAQAHAAAMDAGRGEFYFGEYGPETREALRAREQLQAQATELAGDLSVCEATMQAAFPSAQLVDAPTAADALRFALPRLLSGDYDDAALLDANYLRRPYAELLAKPADHAEGPHS
jgi:tRNA threonylcarbamoyladenosine biosynthesis protein TsaB